MIAQGDGFLIYRIILILLGIASLLHIIWEWFRVASIPNPQKRLEIPATLMTFTALGLLTFSAVYEIFIHIDEVDAQLRSMITLPAFILSIIGLRWLASSCAQKRKDDDVSS